MKFLKDIALIVVLGLSAFGLFLWGAGHYTEAQGAGPDWSPNGDPLADMDHHNALVCGLRTAEAPVVQGHAQVLVHFLGGMGGGQQLRLFPSSRGLCGELVMDHLTIIPVVVMLSPEESPNYSGFTATYWEPTHRPEPAPLYTWATVSLTAEEERWWIQFTFQSASQPITSVTVGVE